MYLIDASYFQRELSIPNINELQSDTGSELTLYIDNKVRSILRDILGYELFNDLDSNITAGVLDGGAPQKWLDFINGNGTDYLGLMFSDGVYKVSLLANYVFYYYLNDNVSQYTATGEKVSQAVNAQNHVSTQRMVTAWNDFVTLYQGKDAGDYYFRGYVNGVLFRDYFGGSENAFKSVYQYLTENRSDFPTATLPTFKHINSLGL